MIVLYVNNIIANSNKLNPKKTNNIKINLIIEKSLVIATFENGMAKTKRYIKYCLKLTGSLWTIIFINLLSGLNSLEKATAGQ